MKLNLPRRTKRRLPTRIRQPLAAPAELNQIWALDFMSDALYGGRAFRTLNFLDEGNRQALGIEVAHSIPSLRVIRVMEQLIEMHGKPKALRVDNGPELTAIAFTEWCANHGIEVRVSADLILTHVAEVKVDHLGEDGGFFRTAHADSGASRGDSGIEASGDGHPSDREGTRAVA
jgi:hypothetical protein